MGNTYSIDVGVRVLGLSVLGKNARGDLVNLGDELEHRVVGKVLLGELALGDVTGVSLAENGVAVTGNNTTGLEGGPEVVGDVLVAKVGADLSLHLGEPLEDFLVGKTVERTGKTVETGREGEEGRAEGRANQVGGVGRDVATLVVGVDGEVESHQLNEIAVLGETELVGQVPRVILVLLDSWDLAVLEDVAVDAGSNGGELCDEVHGVLEGVLPVLGLLDTLGVCLGEGRLVLKSSDGKRELSHWVEGVGATVNQLLDELGDIGAGSPLGREVANLLLGGNLTGEEKPEETYARQSMSVLVGCSVRKCSPSGRGSSPPGALGRSCWHSGIYRVSIELPARSHRGVCLRSCHGNGYPPQSRGRNPVSCVSSYFYIPAFAKSYLPDKGLDTTGTTVDLVKSNLANDLGAVVPTIPW